MFCTNTYRCSYRAWHQSVSPDTIYSYYSYTVINGVAIAKSNIQWNCWDAVYTGAQSLALQAWALLVPQQCCKKSVELLNLGEWRSREDEAPWAGVQPQCYAEHFCTCRSCHGILITVGDLMAHLENSSTGTAGFMPQTSLPTIF